MARGINKVILVGNLGKDPETRYMPSGKAVTNFRIATSESWKDKQTGEQKEQTEWHNIVMYDRLAEIAAEYLRKGSQVYVEGRLRTRKWQDKEGRDRYTTEIIANEMQMLGGRAGGGAGTESRAEPRAARSAGRAGQRPGAVILARRVRRRHPVLTSLARRTCAPGCRPETRVGHRIRASTSATPSCCSRRRWSPCRCSASSASARCSATSAPAC